MNRVFSHHGNLAMGIRRTGIPVVISQEAGVISPAGRAVAMEISNNRQVGRRYLMMGSFFTGVPMGRKRISFPLAPTTGQAMADENIMVASAANTRKVVTDQGYRTESRYACLPLRALASNRIEGLSESPLRCAYLRPDVPARICSTPDRLQIFQR